MDLDKLKNILLIDDSEDIRELARIALESVGGYSVRACNSAEQALQEIEDWQPDLIIVDVMMPGMDGPAFVQQIREDARWSTIPVVFLTAKEDREGLTNNARLGQTAVLGKPFNPVTISSQVEELWMAVPAT